MADEYVTMIDSDIGKKTTNSVANFVVEPGAHPRVAASLCAKFAEQYPRPLKLRILCHGAYGNGAMGTQIGPLVIGLTAKPGYGLWLGGTLYEANVIPTIFSFVYGHFSAVTLMACGAAGRDPAAAPWGSGDGPGLCKALAYSANAPVWAADKPQMFIDLFGGNVALTSWSGNVWQFPADGGEPALMIAA